VLTLSRQFGKPTLRFFQTTPGGVAALIEAVKVKDIATINALALRDPNLITQQMSNDNAALHEAAKNGDVSVILALSKAFPITFDPNYKCHCHVKRTASHYAAEGAHTDALITLLDKGANPNIMDERGRTVMDIALEKKNEPLALLLMQRGGEANIMKAEARELPLRLGVKNYTDNFLKQLPHNDQGFQTLLSDIKAPEARR